MSSRERRKSYRIQDTVAVEYQILSLEEYATARIQWQSQPSGVRNLKNKYSGLLAKGLDIDSFEDSELMRGLLKLVIGINEKVDLILFHLENKKNLSIYRKSPQEVNLSAEGIGFYTSESIPAQSYIKLKLLLPKSPQILITVLGKVAWIRTKQAGEVKQTGEVEKFEVGILFLDIKEDDQEAIINYIFSRQRDILRSRV